ncbi:MAG: carbohydrate-binding protein [Oscillospiraceae bacterium]|nr:carbohydrate-binding protein [Oscillospiraceae bacterium]
MLKKWKQCLASLTACASILAGMPLTQFTQSVHAADAVLAFPGAVGAGKYATGGRGGEIYHVTNLNDSGEGSFRDAVSKSNRIVVFDVSGTIELKSNVVCQSNITIAGQTAPGGSGITLKNYKFGMGGSNVIVRFISSRPGPYKATSSGNDAWGGAGGSNSIVDHCSIGWSSDEQWGLYSKNDNYTCQYTVIGPANSWGGHDKGIHGFGIMFGRANFSFDHNLIIHNVSRNFRGKITDKNAADFTNNIIYDWGYQTTYGTIGHVNYVNNTLKAGNSTASGYHYAQVSDNENFMLYLDGNRILNPDNSVRNDAQSNWSALSYSGNKSEATTKSDSHFLITANNADVSTVLTAESAEDSYQHVIAFAGNGIAPDLRTAIDQQCAEETANGTGSCSGTAAYDASVTDLDKYQIQCGVEYQYPGAVLQKEIVDSDNDGMPDDWEIARGLNPDDASDATGDYCGQGYNNIEYYINDLTVNAFPEGTVTLSPESGTPVEIPSTDAFSRIEAEDYFEESGIRSEDTSDTDGNQNIGFIENGDYVAYKRLNFGDGANSLTMRISGNPSGIEVYLDRLNSEPVASLTFDGSGNFATWQDWTVNLPTTITGIHNVYFKFTGGEGYLVNLNWFRFNQDRVAINGKLAKNLLVSDTDNANHWKFAENLAVGSQIFGDRDFTFTSIPDALTGAEQIMTACDSKNFTGSNLAIFVPVGDITVSVALDTRIENLPAWLTNWTKTDLQVTSSNDVIFDIYQKKFSGSDDAKITLGATEQSAYCVNYAVFLQESAQGTPEKILGDANADGQVTVADLITLQKWLLCQGGLPNWENVDLYKDGKINIFDLCLLKKLLLEQK